MHVCNVNNSKYITNCTLLLHVYMYIHVLLISVTIIRKACATRLQKMSKYGSFPEELTAIYMYIPDIDNVCIHPSHLSL